MTTLAFVPSREMIFTTVGADRKRLLDYCRSLDKPVLALDLSAVVHCDSAGLAFLIEAKRLAYLHKQTCQIVGMTKAIHALAEFCGVDRMLASD